MCNVNRLVLVTENYKGICEHNFLSVIDEFEHELSSAADSWESFYFRSDVSIDFRLCKNEEDLISFLSGKFNNQEGFVSSDDWYWDNEFDRFSDKSIDILKAVSAINNDLRELLPDVWLQQGKSSLDSMISSAKIVAKQQSQPSSLSKNVGEIFL